MRATIIIDRQQGGHPSIQGQAGKEEWWNQQTASRAFKSAVGTQYAQYLEENIGKTVSLAWGSAWQSIGWGRNQAAKLEGCPQRIEIECFSR